MSILALAVTALLSFTDPQSDAYGDGSLKTPTASVNRTIGALDLTQLEVYKNDTLDLGLTFASLTNPFKLPNGFSFPIIEVYLSDAEVPGSTELLPGSAMTLPRGTTWRYAFKLSGDHVQIYEATATGITDISSKSFPKISIAGNTLNLQTALPRPESLKLFAIVGNYSPFSETGWMPTSPSSSSWAYSSDTQTRPVVDVLAASQEQQKVAIETGVLPTIDIPKGGNPWFYVMFAGITLAVLGVIGRFFVKTPVPATPYGPAGTVAEPAEAWEYHDRDDTEETPGERMAAERLKNGETLQPLLSEDNSEPLENVENYTDDLEQDYTDPHLSAPAITAPTITSPLLNNPSPASISPKPVNPSADALFNVWIDDNPNDVFDWSTPAQHVDESPKNDSD
jgi:C-terminal binding-module, SLH-like, of glucodextranase